MTVYGVFSYNGGDDYLVEVFEDEELAEKYCEKNDYDYVRALVPYDAQFLDEEDEDEEDEEFREECFYYTYHSKTQKFSYTIVYEDIEPTVAVTDEDELEVNFCSHTPPDDTNRLFAITRWIIQSKKAEYEQYMLEKKQELKKLLKPQKKEIKK